MCKDFNKFVDKLLGKDLTQSPKPKQESFDVFMDRVLGNSHTQKKSQ